MAKNKKSRSRKSKNKNQNGQALASKQTPSLDFYIYDAKIRESKYNSLKARIGELTPPELWELGRILVFEGCIQEDEKRLDDGVNSLMEAANAETPFPEAVLDLAWVLTFRGLSSMALPYAKQATMLMPDRRDAWAFYARNLLDRNRLEEAKTAIEMACAQSDATEEDKKLLNDLEKGNPIERSGNVTMFFTDEMAIHYVKQAPKEESTRYQLFIMKQLLHHYPENDELIKQNAMLRYFLNEFDQALDLAERYLRKNPEDSEMHTVVGLIHEKCQRIEEAMTAYKKALEYKPTNVRANTNLAKHLMDQGSHVEARPLITRALETDPDDAVANHLYANSLASIEKDHDLEAEFHRKAMALEPQRADFKVSYCFCLLESGKFDTLERYWNKHQHEILKLRTQFPNIATIPILLFPSNQDFESLEMVLDFKDSLNGKAFRKLLDKLIRGVQYAFPKEEWDGVLMDIGMRAGVVKQHDISLKAFLEAEKIEGRGQTASANVAVALNELGQAEEALERARGLDPEMERALTILGNILSSNGKKEEALSIYLRAIHVDKRFFLPLQNGVDIAIQLERWTDAETLLAEMEEREAKPLEKAYLHARYYLARGWYWKVINVLEPALQDSDVLKQEHREEALKKLERLQNLSPDERENMSEEEFMELREHIEGRTQEDLSVFSRENMAAQAAFILAKAYWSCEEPAKSIEVLTDEANAPFINGNWYVLMAECYRKVEDAESIEKIVNFMKAEPPPVLTRALGALVKGDYEQTYKLALQAQSLEYSDENHSFTHPFGMSRAVEFALLAFVALEENKIAEALQLSEQAVKKDPRSSLAAISQFRALLADQQTEAAFALLNRALSYQPGDPDLIRWGVESYLEFEDPERADELLQRERESLNLRNREEMSSFLGEMIAREKLARFADTTHAGSGYSTTDASAAKQEIDWPWVDKLQPSARRWLETAVHYSEYVQWLKLGLAFYLCKVAEMEVVHRLVLPFKESHNSFNLGYDSRLRDLSDFVNESRSHAPALGGILQSLRLASYGESHSDSELLKAWRRYVRNLPWEKSNLLLSNNFLRELEHLKNARNRVAHLGDLNEDDFNALYTFMIKENQPGLFFQALGIQTE